MGAERVRLLARGRSGSPSRRLVGLRWHRKPGVWEPGRWVERTFSRLRRVGSHLLQWRGRAGFAPASVDPFGCGLGDEYSDSGLGEGRSTGSGGLQTSAAYAAHGRSVRKRS